VHNLTFTVENIDETVKALEAEGVPVLLKFAIDWTEYAKLMPDFKLRSNVPPVHMIGSEDKVGFRLELGESPRER
jgi:hypothetical protein